ncbi:NAD(P)/FAD-dependent oxidoreductase [Aquicoccus sp.]|uniref:NAD(P)/FAD-dependent oxidoreductase n=1 Tax=Aquicoccus sp. TaxID=2055851 RepID=UPI00356A2C5F
MKRIFPPFAYSDTRIDHCFWAEAVPETMLERPALQGDHMADVVIIGAGFTGLNAALSLAEAGVQVRVLDLRYPGWGASGRNGGFCCLGGSKLSDASLDRTFGKPARLEWRAAEREAIRHVDKLLHKHGIEADRHSDGETLLAHRPSLARFEGDAAQIEENFGVTPEIIPGEQLSAHGLNAGFHGGMKLPIGFALHPRKYLAGLLQAAEQAGAVVHGDSTVLGIAKQAGAWRVETRHGAVSCENIIVGTNGYSSEDLPDWMAARYMPAQSSVIVTRPLSDAELSAQGWTSHQMAFDTRKLLHYFRLMPDNRFLFGMRGGLRASTASDRAIRRLIRRDFDAMFPAWQHVETSHYWSGMVCLSPSLAPFCGKVPEMPGVYAGFAYHGNGVAMGSYTGARLADMVLGRAGDAPIPAVMQKPPGRFGLGRFRRTLMFAAYAGFRLRDRFA